MSAVEVVPRDGVWTVRVHGCEVAETDDYELAKAWGERLAEQRAIRLQLTTPEGAELTRMVATELTGG